MSHRDFSGNNLRGCSFRNQDLTGADFSGAYIEGTDFSDAILCGAKFAGARTGVRKRWRNVTYCLSSLLGTCLGFASTRFAAQIVGLRDFTIVSSDITDLCKSAQLVSAQSTSAVSGVFAVFTVVLFLIKAKSQGVFSALLLASSMATLCVVAGVFSVVLGEPTIGRLSVETITNIILAVFASIGSSLLFISSTLVAGKRAVLPALPFSAIGAILISSLAKGTIRASLCGDGGLSGSLLAIGIGVLVTYLCLDLSQSCLQENMGNIKGVNKVGNSVDKHSYIRKSSITLAAQLGTCFSGANLTNADFSGAKLKNANFRGAEIGYTQWFRASDIDYANFDNTILDIKVVRDLFCNRDGKGKKYNEIDLHKANLIGIDFTYAQLKGANLEKANLSGANLEYANLKLARLAGANFSSARMTGATIEGWSINSSTIFTGVDCKRVYLREDPDPGSPHGREPSPADGAFEPGDFTKMFQLAQNTFNLILRNGVDRDSLDAALKAIAVSHSGVRLRGIEDRHDGFILITLDVQEDTNKADLQRDFHQIYQETLQRIIDDHENNFNKLKRELESANSVVKELTGIVKSRNSRGNVNLLFSGDNLDDLTEGFTVWADINNEGHRNPIKLPGSLPPAPDLSRVYKKWQDLFGNIYAGGSRIQFNQEPMIANISRRELKGYGEQIQQLLNQWLRSDSFREIEDKLRECFHPNDEVRVSIVTENVMLRSLPWELWKYLNISYRRASFALGSSSEPYQQEVETNRSEMRILVVLGNSQGINVEKDKEIFEDILKGKADLVFLTEPKRSDLNEALWDNHGFDILAFSGHGPSFLNGGEGGVSINQNDELNPQEISHALSVAVERGLQLAIFNSCNGLGLAQTLNSLNIPYFVLMKEAIPDMVAQEFLKIFIRELAKNQSIYSAMRIAKQFLQGQVEYRYLYASWLPTLFHNSKSSQFQWRS